MRKCHNKINVLRCFGLVTVATFEIVICLNKWQCLSVIIFSVVHIYTKKDKCNNEENRYMRQRLMSGTQMIFFSWFVASNFFCICSNSHYNEYSYKIKLNSLLSKSPLILCYHLMNSADLLSFENSRTTVHMVMPCKIPTDLMYCNVIRISGRGSNWIFQV